MIDFIETLKSIDMEIELLQAERKSILAEIVEREWPNVTEAYKRNDKTHGKITLKRVGYDIEVDTRQTVTWDQAKLNAASQNIDAAECQHIFKVELSVPERIYNALPPGKTKKLLTDARTTKLSAPSIKVVFPTGDKS